MAALYLFNGTAYGSVCMGCFYLSTGCKVALYINLKSSVFLIDRLFKHLLFLNWCLYSIDFDEFNFLC